MTTAAPELTRVRVYGTPAPQGSKRHVGRGIMVESSKHVKPWREAVKTAVLDHLGYAPTPLDGPVTVDMTFLLPRPKGHFGTGRNAGQLRASAPDVPTVKPDVDKLLRSTLDALVDVGAIGDDSQVVIISARKTYVPAGQSPGAVIDVSGMA